MIENDLLKEFVEKNPGSMQQRICEEFDTVLLESADEEAAIERVKSVLSDLLQDKIATITGEQDANSVD